MDSNLCSGQMSCWAVQVLKVASKLACCAHWRLCRFPFSLPVKIAAMSPSLESCYFSSHNATIQPCIIRGTNDSPPKGALRQVSTQSLIRVLGPINLPEIAVQCLWSWLGWELKRFE